jgi:hypothetical protein
LPAYSRRCDIFGCSNTWHEDNNNVTREMGWHYRVTRSGEFSPIGQLLTLSSYFENIKSFPNFGLPFFTKMDWATS